MDDALATFMQILQVTGQDILFILHHFQYVGNALSDDVRIQLKFITHLPVHAPDAVFEIDHNDADGPYIEQLFGNGVHYPYFLRYFGVHKGLCLSCRMAKVGLKRIVGKETGRNQYSILAQIYSIIHTFTSFN